MKTIYLIVGTLTGLLLVSTLICGLWIKANHINDVESLNFHMNIGIGSIVFGLISVMLLIVQVARH